MKEGIERKKQSPVGSYLDELEHRFHNRNNAIVRELP